MSSRVLSNVSVGSLGVGDVGEPKDAREHVPADSLGPTLPHQDLAYWRARALALEERTLALEAQTVLSQERQAWILEIGALMARRQNPSDAMGVLLDRIVRLVGGTRGAVYLVEADGLHISARTIVGGRLKEIRLALGEGIAGHCAKTRRVINVKEALKDPRWRFAFDHLTGFETQAVLCVPMLDTRGDLLGVIQILNKVDGGYFDLDDEHTLVSVASSVGVLVENFRYYLEQMNQNMELHEIRLNLEERVRELDVLSQLQRTMTDAQSVHDEIAAIAQAAFRLVPAEACIVSFYEDGVLSRTLFTDEGRVARAMSEKSAYFDLLVERNRPMLLDDAWMRLPNFGFDANTCYSYLGMPVRDENTIVGGIELVKGRPARAIYDEEHAKVMVLVAGQFGRAVARNRERRQRESDGRIAALGAMLSGVMHDLNTPLSICSGYVQLMTRVDDSAQRADMARIVAKQFADIQEMTREVIAYARGEVQLYERRCDIQHLSEELKRSLSTSLAGTSIALSVECLASGTLYLDEGKLKRIVFNLARNAKEAMVERGAHLWIRLERAHDAHLVVEVRDDGPGIPPEIAGRAFEAFVTRGKLGGTGLGLSIVQRLVDELSGAIAVTTSSEGTTFSLTIPWSDEARVAD